MSLFTNYGENKIADWLRAQGLTLPANWYVAPLSAASDSSVTEVTGSGIARAAVVRGLAAFAGTQGAGTTLASTGTSHATSNNSLIDMGTAAGAVGTVTHVGLFDASSGGNCWAYVELSAPIVTAAAVVIQVAAGALGLVVGLSSGMSNYLSNKFIDLFFRAQAYSLPATFYLAAYTAAPNNAGGGTEVGGGVGYSRLAVAMSLTSFSGTQAAGSTAASSGTAGRTSNNATLTLATPSGAWGTVGWLAFHDASSGGNLLFWGAMAAAKSVGVGAPLYVLADKLGITIA
jgi:hypothetical protein